MRKLLPFLLAGCTGEPTYHQDIEPIIARSCASCHAFTVDEITDRAETIAFLTQSRMMPPFGVDNSGSCNRYRDARWLSKEEIELIDRWVSGSRLRGEPRQIERAPSLQIEPSAFALMKSEYTPPSDRSDDYRCFVVDPELAEDGFVTGYRIEPGDARIVHHVLVFTADGPEARARAAELDGADGGPGYSCFGGSLLPITASRLIAGFAPGTGDTRYPEGTGIPIDAGTKLVLQMHYNTALGAFPDRTGIALELRASVDRPAVIAAAADLGLSLEPGAERITSGPIQIRVPGVGAFIHGVFPHMHHRGRTMSAAIVRPDDTRECMTEVQRWDFDYQQFYFFEAPLYGGSNDRIELSCSFDTRGDSERIRFGEETEDEMCLLGLYVTLN